MTRYKAMNLMFLFVAATIAVQVAVQGLSEPGPWPSGPKTMQDVIALAEKLGLHFRNDQDFRSDHNELIVSRRVDADWVGTVAVYRHWEMELELDQVVPWGELFLYGDRSLIKELTGRTDLDNAW